MSDQELSALAALVQAESVRARAFLQQAIAYDQPPQADPSHISEAEAALDAELRARGILK